MFEQKGGYTEVSKNLYNQRGAKHAMAPSQEALDALHAIQETPWQINEKAMQFVDYLMGAGAKGPLGFDNSGDVIPTLSPLEYATLSKKERKDLAAAKQRRKAGLSKQSAVMQRISIAQDLRDKAEFYQPQYMDFRGRVYPMNTRFNNQADHWSKGMMQFKNGVALGERGLYNLKAHVANCWGYDKLQIEERVAKVDERVSDLYEVADSFELAAKYCAEADEPLAFYAAACDLIDALRSDAPEQHESKIACAVDGTCNGLQILSLLGHDAVGADKTNCTSNPMRQDVYMEVADIAIKEVEQDLKSDGVYVVKDVDNNDVEVKIADVAAVWHAHLKDPSKRRKAVKRAIMTTAYGVSEHTIGTNLIDDGIVDKLDIPETFDFMAVNRCRSLMADYFRNKIVSARAGAIEAAVKIMDYFTEVAQTLGKANVPLRWTTPDGLVVEQSYRKTRVSKLQTVELGALTFKTMLDSLDARKCGSGAAPQVVHSLDAAMLRQVARRLNAENIADMCMIHDSYGVHAGHIDRLGVILREVAIEIFKGDWLAESFHVEQSAHGIELPKPPALGDLDVENELRASVYFFS